MQMVGIQSRNRARPWPFKKLQTPSSKLQRNIKLQISTGGANGGFNFIGIVLSMLEPGIGAWRFFGV
jgi:hypothetical protein